MDTLETYIKMNEKAEEIQKYHGWTDGDLMWAITYSTETCFFCSGCHQFEKFPLSMFVWLPRQDQLQEMIRNKYVASVMVQEKGHEVEPYVIPLMALTYAFYEFACLMNTIGTDEVLRDKTLLPQYKGEIRDIKYIEQFTSMEQLWLAFAMLILYHKRWYNGEWKLGKGV